MSDLLTNVSVRAFFEELVSEVLARQRGDQHAGHGDAENYLIDLLCQFAFQPLQPPEKPLGVALAASETGHSDRRYEQLKSIGDHALCMTGLFTKNLERRKLDPKYYRDIGGTAYGRLSDLMDRKRRAAQAAMFNQLSEEFRLFSEVLREVRAHSTPADDIETLFRDWMETGSQTSTARLAKLGVQLPPPGSRSKN